jgi:hypothetical protein
MIGNGSFEDAFKRVAQAGEFLNGLAKLGVGVKHLLAALKDEDHMAAIAQAILAPEEALEARCVAFGKVADDADFDPFVTMLLDEEIVRSDKQARYYNDAAGVTALLSVVRLSAWQRAAIVLFYGLGGEAPLQDGHQLSEKLGRAASTVTAFLGFGMGMHGSKLSSAHGRLSCKYSAALRDALELPKAQSYDVDSLVWAGIRSLDELCELTEADLAQLAYDPAYPDEFVSTIKSALDRLGRSLRQ